MGITKDSYRVVKQSKGIPPQSLNFEMRRKIFNRQAALLATVLSINGLFIIFRAHYDIC